MLLKVKTLFYVLLAAGLIAACSGEDGDPGPQGEQGEQGEKGEAGADALQKNGFFEGTVSGNRQDSTAFNYPFKFEYAYDSIQAFANEGDVKTLSLTRYSDRSGDAFLTLNLQSPSEGVLLPAFNSYSGYFRFFKELDSDNLFAINARPYFEATTAYVRELSLALNKTHKFSTNGSDGKIWYYQSNYYGTGSAQPAYVFSTYNNEGSYSIYYSYDTGALLGLYNYSLGEYIASGALFDQYNTLTFKFNATVGELVFHNASTNAGLYELVPDVPADQLNITNYTRNATTGVVTFDFELIISGTISNYYRTNTTGHNLTIKGKFNSGGRVYKSTVGRSRG